MSDACLQPLREELERELVDGILPYWMTQAVDDVHGGFVGQIDEGEVRRPDAPKSAVLMTRLLWTFSAAYRVVGRDEYRAMAQRAAQVVRGALTDPEHGGVYWMLHADGAPADRRKHVYAQAFATYALAEHARATGDDDSLRAAVDLFRLVEAHAHDARRGGYVEAFDRAWRPLADVRLSDIDAPERRSTNTHLHLVEAYAGLLRVWPNVLLRRRVAELLELFLGRIVQRDGRSFGLFFDDDWTPRSTVVSYGHDVEASWLLLDAADAVGDAALRARVREVCLTVAAAVRDDALDDAGGIFYERRADGSVLTDKEWWPQAEAIVGFANAWQESGDRSFLDAATRTWRFTQRHLVDARHGEWFRAVARDGTLRAGHEKVGPWKCPYHDARACLELIVRAGATVAAVKTA